MTKVKCENISCKYNSSNKPMSVGECTKEEITLTYQCTEDEQTEYLDCKEFKWKKGLGYDK